ncbi:MAG: sn-glycerol-1-phosphate dehydrogenase [Clostridia bacterium]|nr:sn-glycerol-1-phosphate dehydrogenase [Clostridia bacterium]
MDISKLSKKFSNCSCGKAHLCDIKAIEIGAGALNKLSSLCKEYKNILVVFDTNTYSICGKQIEELLKLKTITVQVLKAQEKVVIPNEEKLEEIEKQISNSCDLIIGVGSGVINDLCKKVSFDKNLPYFIVATAPSMDGYASVGSALILKGMKVTLNARPPLAIIADTKILKDAPFDMIKAGYGDIVGKFSCLNDWLISSFINGEYFCKKIYTLTYKCATKIKRLGSNIKNREESAIGKLMEALVLVGVLMSFVGSSRPASGSEHHLSHYFEITGILDNTEYFAHGIDVVYSATFLAKLREKMLLTTPKRVEFNREEYEKEVNRIYSKSASEVLKLQERLGWYYKDDSEFIYKNFNKIKKILKKVPNFNEFNKMLNAVGLNYNEFENLYSKQKLDDAILYAKDLKDRYTFLWLYYAYFR